MLLLSEWMKSHSIATGGGTIFKVRGGGANFWSQKMAIKIGALAPAVVLARRRGCLRRDVPPHKLELSENEVLNKAIWCTIFHHVKHLTVCLRGAFFTLEQDSQKSGGAMPPAWKVEGPLAPPSPGSAAYVYSVKQSLKFLEMAPDFFFEGGIFWGNMHHL